MDLFWRFLVKEGESYFFFPLPIKIDHIYFWTLNTIYVSNSQTVTMTHWIYFWSLCLKNIKILASSSAGVNQHNFSDLCWAGLVQGLSYALRHFCFRMLWFSFAFSHLSGIVQTINPWMSELFWGPANLLLTVFSPWDNIT